MFRNQAFTGLQSSAWLKTACGQHILTENKKDDLVFSLKLHYGANLSARDGILEMPHAF